MPLALGTVLCSVFYKNAVKDKASDSKHRLQEFGMGQQLHTDGAKDIQGIKKTYWYLSALACPTPKQCFPDGRERMRGLGRVGECFASNWSTLGSPREHRGASFKN